MFVMWKQLPRKEPTICSSAAFVSEYCDVMSTLGDRLYSVSTDVSTHTANDVKRCLLIIMLCPFRYGWTNNLSTAILRHTHHENCAKNMTGFIIHLNVNAEEAFDAYCYDDKGDYIHRK